jgi:general secretion pathway protein E
MVGRLLFSTLHTNDATGAVLRLIDIGVEPYLVASTLAMVMGQRLVRRICPNCKASVPVSAEGIAAIRSRPDFEATIRLLQAQNVLGKGEDPLAGVRLFRGRGCPQCQGSGFRGRLGIFEVFEISQGIRQMMMERREAGAIRAAAIAAGMKTLFQDGLAKALLGETSLEEVARVAL